MRIVNVQEAGDQHAKPKPQIIRQAFWRSGIESVL